MSPQNQKRFDNSFIGDNKGAGNSTSPVGYGFANKKKTGDDNSGTASLGQKMMSYFYNK